MWCSHSPVATRQTPAQVLKIHSVGGNRQPCAEPFFHLQFNISFSGAFSLCQKFSLHRVPDPIGIHGSILLFTSSHRANGDGSGNGERAERRQAEDSQYPYCFTTDTIIIIIYFVRRCFALALLLFFSLRRLPSSPS